MGVLMSGRFLLSSDNGIVSDMKTKQIVWLLAILALLSTCGCAQTSKYARKLERGAAYDPSSTAVVEPMIEFSYQDASHPDLIALCEALAFDEYLSSRAHLSETELIIDMIGYVHALVPWNGSAQWPSGSLNTLSILSHDKNTEEGVNCRMKAIILQELYLAAELPARMISCIPLDDKDSDSHVIVSVWSSELNKWIWADPSFNAYVLDRDGNLASIEDVRKGLVEGHTFFLNSDAVVQEKPLSESFYFGYYMRKNLYAFITPMEAKYNYEGSEGARYSIMLLPAIELPLDSEQLIEQYRFRDSFYTRYSISNPQLFWEPPQKTI